MCDLCNKTGIIHVFTAQNPIFCGQIQPNYATIYEVKAGVSS